MLTVSFWVLLTSCPPTPPTVVKTVGEEVDKAPGTPHSIPHLLGHSQANSDGVPCHNPMPKDGYTGLRREMGPSKAGVTAWALDRGQARGKKSEDAPLEEGETRARGCW